ncbi:MAG: DUF1456 family protein [Mucilaginibacter sp.]|nr:DUF1456 family protein [Mucilaginibacter sp.]
MSNNDIMKKLRVALQLRDDDIVHICSLVNFHTTKTELGAIFRDKDHPNFKPCGDQLLRNFLNGLIVFKRGPMEKKPAQSKASPGQSSDKKTGQ